MLFDPGGFGRTDSYACSIPIRVIRVRVVRLRRGLKSHLLSQHF
jgi:hypothetical protein